MEPYFGQGVSKKYQLVVGYNNYADVDLVVEVKRFSFIECEFGIGDNFPVFRYTIDPPVVF